MTDARPAGGVVLIAEDDRDIRDLVTVKLQAAGYQVIAVNDGLQALRQIRELRPDLALLDVMMPGISGLDIIATLAPGPEHRDRAGDPDVGPQPGVRRAVGPGPGRGGLHRQAVQPT